MDNIEVVVRVIAHQRKKVRHKIVSETFFAAQSLDAAKDIITASIKASYANTDVKINSNGAGIWHWIYTMTNGDYMSCEVITVHTQAQHI